MKEQIWGVIHTIESATKKDDVSSLDRRVLEGLLLDVYEKLYELAV